MRSISWTCLSVLLTVVLAGAPDAVAQTASAALAGEVTTSEGDPVVDAVVQARLESTGAVRTTLSDRRGRYRLEGLRPGRWTVVARLAEGSLSDSRSVELHLQQTATLDFVVGGGLTERVTVRAESPVADRERVGGEMLIGGDRAEALPLAGRVFTDLALLDSSIRPAAPGNFAGERGAVFVVNGQSGRSNSFLVDGLDNNDATSGTATSSFFSQQVMREFVLLTHQFAPEFGRASGGLVNLVTRQGNNEPTWEAFVQGTAVEWNQSGAFVKSLNESGTAQDSVQRLQTGLAFGGPLRKDRAFYFASYEHQQADAILPYTGIDALGDKGGLLVAPFRDDTLFFRTDFNLGGSHSLMMRLSANDRTAEGVNVEGVNTPDTGFRLEQSALQFASTLTTVISPRLLSETRLLASTSSFDQFANSGDPGVSRPSGNFGGNALNRQKRDETKFQLVQNLTMRAGAHNLKFGFDLTRSHTGLDVRFNPNGGFIYDYDFPFEPGDCGDILVSQVSSAAANGTLFCLFDPNGIDDDGDGVVDELANIYSYPKVYTLIEGEPRATLKDTQFSLFAQDKVSLGQRWLLEYGLRYDANTFELPSSARVDSSIPNGGAVRDRDNLAPRFGFTFTPKADGRWIVRGGGGVFYDKLVLAFPAVAGIMSGTKVGIFPLQGFAVELTESDVLGGGTIPVFFPEPLTMRFSTGTELETPYAVQYTLGVERALGRRATVRADVVRALGYHQPIMRDLNPVTGLVSGEHGLPLLTGQATACPVDRIDPSLDVGVPCHARDPERGSIAAVVTEGRNWYTGLNLNWSWQRDDSWLRASYTLSRAEDMGFDPLKGGLALPPDSDDLTPERGRADGDRLHRLVLSGDGVLPWWGLRSTAVIQLSSGMPYNVTTGQDGNDDGILTDRPAGIARNAGEDASLAAINAQRDQQVVPLAPIVSVPEEPSFFQIDVKLYRSFAVSSQRRIQGELYLQVINLVNRENVGLLEGRAMSPDFGRTVTLAGPPRTLELGLRLTH